MSDEKNPVQVRVYVETPDGPVEDFIEVDRAEWDAMSPKERHADLVEAAVDHQNNISPCGFEVLGEDDRANVDPRQQEEEK